jgi:hypothetical protein
LNEYTPWTRLTRFTEEHGAGASAAYAELWNGHDAVFRKQQHDQCPMNALESHPLRITDRDLLKEVSQDEWFASFKGLDLHIRVSAAAAAPRHAHAAKIAFLNGSMKELSTRSGFQTTFNCSTSRITRTSTSISLQAHNMTGMHCGIKEPEHPLPQSRAVISRQTCTSTVPFTQQLPHVSSIVDSPKQAPALKRVTQTYS